jgi:hypothetical protein
MEPLTARQIRWERFVRSGLSEPFADPHDAAHALAGIQAQILPAAGLAIANRVPDFGQADLDALLHDARSLVKLWGQRGTLHLYAVQDWPLMVSAMQLYPTWWARSAAKGELDPVAFESAVSKTGRELAVRGVLKRSDLRAPDMEISPDLLSSWGGVFAELVRRGQACHAGRDSAQGVFAHREHWAPDLDWSPPATFDANVELARRYFAAYGPATVADLAFWRGGLVTDARAWVSALGDELDSVRSVEDGDENAVSQSPRRGRDKSKAARSQGHGAGSAPGKVTTLYYARARGLVADRIPEPTPENWPVRLLYRFDPLLLAHKDKGALVDPGRYKAVWRPAGHIEGTVLVDGRIAGTWNYRRRANHLDIAVAAFQSLSAGHRTQIRREAAAKAAYFALSPGRITIERT